jgi:hypothetical protein
VTFFVAVVFLFFYQQELQGLQMALDAPLQLLECLKHTAVTVIHHVTTKKLCLVCNFAVQQLISDTRSLYEAKLGNFLSQAQKRAVQDPFFSIFAFFLSVDTQQSVLLILQFEEILRNFIDMALPSSNR